MAGKDDLSGEIQKLKAASEESFRKLNEIQGRIEALQKRLAQRAESTSSHPGNKPRRAS